MNIGYRVLLDDPGAHEFVVELMVSGLAASYVDLALPAWIPGSYMIRDFARNLIDMQRLDNGPAPRKLDKRRWRIKGICGAFSLRCRVYALDLSVHSAYFDDTRAYFNGTSLFLRLEGMEDEEVTIDLFAPAWPGAEDWAVATILPVVDINARGFGRYRADNYAQLIDHPVEIGHFERVSFMVDAVPHEMVLVDAQGVDIRRIASDVAPICAEHAAMFSELPVCCYQFLTLATRDGCGGLEHRDSSSLICKRSDLPWRGTGEVINERYRQYLALCSHEYFHLWNVKRIHPALFAEADLSCEVYSELLWAFEGITSYYDELALTRAGVIDRDGYLDMLAPSITRYYRNTGRHRQSVAESSFDAWTRFYKQDENAPNAIVSYYNKGALVAFGLDHLLRIRSDDQLSLDDLMRRLWQEYGRPGRGLPERFIEREIETLLGESVEDYFTRYIYGTEELPLTDWFSDFGVGLQVRPAVSMEDTGGYVEQSAKEDRAQAAFGARLRDHDGWVRVEQVFTGSAAARAGVSPGDLLVAIDGERCILSNVDELLRRHVLESEVKLTLFRRDLLREVVLPVLAAPWDTVDLYWLADRQLEETVRRRRERWLASVRGV